LHAAAQSVCGVVGPANEWLDTELCLAMLQVIPPGEVGTCFDDIGALDNVKSALREVPTCTTHLLVKAITCAVTLLLDNSSS
jgi:hypothetical protein